MLNNPTNPQRIAVGNRLTTHCIVVGITDHTSATFRFKNQTVQPNAITALPTCDVTSISSALSDLKSDLVFFLDSRDTWSGEFLSRMRSAYEKHPDADVVICGSHPLNTPLTKNTPETPALDLGFTAVSTYANLDYVAQPLSCLSLRRRIVERILPLVDDPDWREQPAACLLIAASLASARTYHLPNCLVAAEPRENCVQSPDFPERLKRMRLVGKIANQLGLNPDFVEKFLAWEYDSRPKDAHTIANYSRLVKAHLPPSRARQRILAAMHRDLKKHLSAPRSANQSAVGR